MWWLSLKKGAGTYLKDRGWNVFSSAVRAVCGSSSVN